MNLDSLSFALSQISYSVANLTKKNYKSSVGEIQHLVDQHGSEADRHLFRCLFSHVDFSGDGKTSGKDFHQTQYLIQEFTSLIKKPNFISVLCYAIDNPLHHQKTLKSSQQLFNQLSKVLKLNRVQEVVLGLALLNSASPDTRNYATQFVKTRLPQLITNYLEETSGSGGEGGLQDLPIETLQLILTYLSQGSKDQLGVTQENKDNFFSAVRKDFPLERVPVVLGPLLYPNQQELALDKLSPESVSLPRTIMESTSVADMLMEVGYGCTASLEECRNTLVQFGVREITAVSVARVLGMMSRTTNGLSEHISLQALSTGAGMWNDAKDKLDSSGPLTWNVDIFVQVVKDLVPHLNFKDVVAELDYVGFSVPNKVGLKLLVQGLFRGIQDVFPIEAFYKHWKNTDGQLSWIKESLNNPDIFCFGDYQCHSVVVDLLKTPPDEDSRNISTWKSLDLVETLLWLSDSGHYHAVLELFSFPIQHCPDMLVFALLQIPMWTNLKSELLSTLMPIFLGSHPNSAIVLQYAWHCQGQSTNIRTLLMRSMADWYMRGDGQDQTRLSRILDVAQDLKSLSMLLSASPFAFVIDLACLASRREYLKLDKWLTDKMREHGEQFVQAIVQFLKRRCPQLMGSNISDELQTKSQQLPTDTVVLILHCLHAIVGNVNKDLAEVIMTMFSNAGVLQKIRQPNPQAVVGKPNSMPPPPMPNLPNPVANPIDALTGLGSVNLGNPVNSGPVNSGFPTSVGGPTGAGVGAGVSTAVNTPFPGNLAMSSTPGSPAKAFGNMTQVSQAQAFNAMQTLASQLQGLSMTSSSNTQSTAGRALSLGAMSAQAALKHQQTADKLRQEAEGRPNVTAQSGDVTSIFPAMNQQFSKDIEDEANSYFQRIYNHPPNPTIPIDEVLEMLKRFKDSVSRKEKDVFACMLRNLFDEYKFFPQYPEKELHTTAVLFGGIIEQGLVTYMDLGIALRYVLEALKKPNGSKMYSFGIAALDRFKTRLKDYPQYCQHLASIPHYSHFPQHLQEYIECGARSQEPAVGSHNISVPPPVAAPGVVGLASAITGSGITPMGAVTSRSLTPVTTGATVPTTTAAATTMPAPTHGAISRPANATRQDSRPSIANATNIDTLLAGTDNKEEIIVPPESVQDKVFFIFNNLSLANMEAKSSELREQITKDYYVWSAQYLVMKRASIEPNFHTLYANFLDVLKLDDVVLLVVRETYRNIKVLLRSDKGVANFSDRSLLKNLGHWLGMLTLAKNKPILHIDIDLKSLLYEAYHKGAQELLYVVPFVAKVVESCAKSKVFRPPNPWTMAIMNALAELHQEPDLKLNLKFEIEVLCKTLNLDIGDLKPGNYLKETERFTMLEHQLSAPKATKETSSTPQADEPLVINMPTPTTTVITATPTTTTATTATTSVAPPIQPAFGYHEINVLSLAGIGPHVNINEQLAIFQAHPQLKQFVRPAIERAVQDLLPPVVERSIKIALTTCEQIVKKDFALDPEETRIRAAAHHMVRFMTAGMALITCREPLLISISTNLKQAWLTAVRGATQQQKDLIEQASQVVAHDNTELACCFIQKTAVEKAIPEMDKRLATEFELRKHARTEGRRYCDPVVLTYQAERMPEQIRLKVGSVTHQQIAVYEEFARNTPGFLAVSQDTATSGIPKQPDEISTIYEKVAREIESNMHNMIPMPPSSPQMMQLRGLLDQVLIARNSRDLMPAINLLQKAVEGLLDGLGSMPGDPEIMLRYRDCHLLVLKGLQDHRAYGPQWTNSKVTRCLMECRDEFRYNVDAVDCLIRAHLVQMQQYDQHLAASMENGLNYMAVAFSMQLVQRFCVEDKQATQGMKASLTKQVQYQNDFFYTIENLARIAAHSRQAPDGLAGLIENIRQNADTALLDRVQGGPTSMMHSGISQAREFDDPPGLHEKTEYLLREWVQMYHSPGAGRDSTKAFSAFVGQMHQQGILKTDDLITRFFRLCTEMCVDLCYRALAEANPSPTLIRAKCFHTLDAFVRLISLLVKHSGDATNTVTKINLLNKVLGIVAGVLLQDHEVRHNEFQQLPYHRIFIMLFIELNAPEHVLESINFSVLTAFCNTFHILRPSKAPGFAYAWLEFISHRVFIGRMLAITKQQRQGWNFYAQLLIDLFKFLSPFLRNAELTKPTQLLYKGTLRVLLVLLHDFPEFLCDYHYAFCDVIPPNCIQMRNLILSAFPRNMRLPDPFTPCLKVDTLPEISQAPRVLTNFATMIQPATFKKDLDSYLKIRSPVTFLSELRGNLQVSNDPGMRYNIPLINALVLYVGTQAIEFIHSRGHTPSMSTIAHSSHMDIFQNLAVDLDTEGRYLFLNAIANQLRYPNSHTHYFSCTLLYLFAEANTEAIQEQITRVLLERLIVNRPHPWGLLITFIELIKNPQFKFWNHEFVHCAPEIEKLFESVARSCMQPKQAQGLGREQEAQDVH